MRADIVPGARLPDYELTDHRGHPKIAVRYALSSRMPRPLDRPGLRENWEGDRNRSGGAAARPQVHSLLKQWYLS
jgi:hypothetical protein